MMSDNVARILERGERLDNIDSRAEALNQSVSLVADDKTKFKL